MCTVTVIVLVCLGASSLPVLGMPWAPSWSPCFLWAHTAYLKLFWHSLGAQVTRALGLGRGVALGAQPVHVVDMAVMGARSQAVELGTATPCQPRRDLTGPGVRSRAILGVGGWARVQLVGGSTGKVCYKE